MVPLRTVRDTNVFISVFLLHGRSALLAQGLFERRVVLFVSEQILEEYYEVAVRPRFRSTREEVRALLEGMGPWMTLVRNPGSLRVPSLRDQDDLKFLECAVAAGARHLIIGDQDLLHLRRYRQVRIVSIFAFLEQIEGFHST